MSTPNEAGSPTNRSDRRHDSLIQALTLVLSRAPRLTNALFNIQIIIRDVTEVIRKYLKELLGAALVAGGLGAIIPSLAVVIVNAVGFTSGGVLAGSLAATLQSVVYGGTAGGVFSSLQAFGATAMIAHPAVLASGSLFIIGGIGLASYSWWRKKKEREAELAARAAAGPSDSKAENQQVVRSRDGSSLSWFLNFGQFRRRN